LSHCFCARRQLVPTYEYKCSNCLFVFDLRRSMEDDSSVLCPNCHGPANQVFSSVPVFFKGEGFYSTERKRSWLEKPGMDEAMADAKSTLDKSLRGE
jgi:putative FmdB family regulatory protein